MLDDGVGLTEFFQSYVNLPREDFKEKLKLSLINLRTEWQVGLEDGIPSEWTCDPNYYNARDGCDCNCGAWDPDCDITNDTMRYP